MNGTTSSTRRVPRLLAAVVIATMGATIAYAKVEIGLGISIGNSCCRVQYCYDDINGPTFASDCKRCQPGQKCLTFGGCDDGVAWANAWCIDQ